MGTQGSSAPLNPSMAYYQPGGALSFASPQAGYGGIDPQTLAMLYGTPAPQSPYSKKLDEAASQVLGDPSNLGGALSSAQDRYDQAVQEKLAAIRRAAAMISGTRGTSNTPLMAFGAGLLQNAPTFGSALGNAFSAALPQIQNQREQERFIAENVGKLGIEGGDTNINAALEDQGSIEKRLQLSGQLENQAGNIQARSDLANARNRSSVMQYAGRIGVAELNQNKNRWKFIGNDPNDPTVGQYEDQNAPPGRPVVVAGPPSTGTRAGATRPSHFEEMQQAWLALYPNDKAGALDYASGHRTLTPQEMYRSARTLAGRELGAGADPQDIEDATNKIYGSMARPPGAQAAPTNTPPPANNKPAPQQPQGGGAQQPQPMTPVEREQSIANAKAAIARNPSARPEIIKRLQQAGIPTVGL